MIAGFVAPTVRTCSTLAMSLAILCLVTEAGAGHSIQSNSCTFSRVRHSQRLIRHLRVRHLQGRGISSNNRTSETIRTLEDVPSAFISRTVISVSGEIDCPGIDQLPINFPLRRCPVYHVIEFDKFRIPVTMVQMRCRCDSCLGPWNEGEESRCRPIQQTTRVLRVVQCDSLGVYRYAPVLEPVTSGCSCVSYRDIEWRSRAVMEEK